MGVQVREKPPGSGVWWIFVNHQGQRKSKQIVAEEKRRDKSGLYKWEHIRGENHYLDAEIYAGCLVDPVCFGGLGVIPDPKKKAAPTTGRPTGNQRKSNWINQGVDTSNWLGR